MVAATQHIDVATYQKEVEVEWKAILQYWMEYTVDKQFGGFYGAVNNNNEPDVTAAKGLVLNSRILWSFSAAYIHFKDEKYLAIAKRAYQYLIDFFIDKKNGGAFWSVNQFGEMLDGKKQIYGVAFCIYGMSEYYKATQNNEALQTCKSLYHIIEAHSFDANNGGFFEAFTNDWKPIDDLRLSEKDANEKKTMNTHLHVVEAYANLYLIWNDNELKQKIELLLNVFEQHIINKNTQHLGLFFDEQWQSKSTIISYGHDVEAAWLLLECAEIINNDKVINQFKELSISIVHAASKGLSADGGLWYEYDADTNHLIKEKHNWPQAEAMVGFFNAYQVSGNELYLQQSISSWAFIKKHIKDTNKGEWFWGVNEDNSIMQNQNKAGFWKCPYHSTRACKEIINRINLLGLNIKKL